MINKTIITTLTILLFNLSAINVTHAQKLEFDLCDYVGETKKGKAYDMGNLSCDDGTNYFGEFRGNRIHGDGILIILPPKISRDFLEQNPFPVIGDRETILKLLDQMVTNAIKFEDIEDILTDEGQERMRQEQLRLKKQLFKFADLTEWLNLVLNQTEIKEQDILNDIQIFVGKFKNGKFIEYFDPDKKFRRVTKLKKLDKIGGGEGNQAALPPLQNLGQLPKPNGLDFNNNGTIFF